MKKTTLLIALITLTVIHCFSQTPQAINYQAVARDTDGSVLTNQNISVRISIITGSIAGTTVYSESHAVTTNAYGAFAIEIGSGTILSGTFSGIDWGTDDKFIKVEADKTGGTNYEELSISQFLSVPYALHAENVTNKDDADADPANELITTAILDGDTLEITDAGGLKKVNLETLKDGTGTDNQQLSLSNDTIYLSDGGFIELPAEVDGDITNELQTISISNDSIYLTDGGNLKLPADLVDDADANATNEIQALSISNDTIYLSNGGFVKIPEQNGDFSNGGENGSAIRMLGNTDNYGLGFLTNNDTAIFIDSAGNVGIGTINPGKILDISTTTAWDGINFESTSHSAHKFSAKNGESWIQVNSNSGNSTGFQFYENDFTTYRGSIYSTNDNTNSRFGIYWNGKERISIPDDGNVGINTMYPSGKLHVQGGTTGDADSAFVVTSDGKVGIGNTNPRVKLDVIGRILVGTTADTIDWPETKLVASYSNTDQTNWPYLTGIVGEAASTSIVGMGVVGYGKTSASKESLGVWGSCLVNNSSDTTQARGVSGYVSTIHTGGPNIGVYGHAKNGATNFSFYGNAGTLYNEGNVGINTTTPAGKLHVQGGTTGSADSAFVVTSDGKVGIGTTSPDENLHINGNLKVNGYSYLNSIISSDGTARTNFYYNNTTQKRLILCYGNEQASIRANTTAFSPSENINSGGYAGLHLVTSTSSHYQANSSRAVAINNYGGIPTIFGYGAYLRIGDTATATLASTEDDLFVSGIFETSGINYFANNVGIGNTSPNYKLDVSGDINYTGTLRKNGSAVNLNGDFSNGGEADGAIRTLGNTDNYGLGLLTNNDTAIFIDSAGNVGIGTTNPTYKLNVNGTSYLGGEISTGGQLQVYGNISSNVSGGKLLFREDASASNPSLAVRFDENTGIYSSGEDTLAIVTGGQDRITIDNSGNVGIGTTSPKNKLDIEGGAVIGATYSGTNTAPTNGLLVEGNVGIGTTSPAFPLHIQKSSHCQVKIESTNGRATLFLDAPGSNTHELYFRNSTNGQSWIIHQQAGSDDLRFYTTAAGLGNIMSLQQSTGNVGIGTTDPKNKLDIEGGAVIGATYSGTNTAPTNGLLVKGNVGIGTTSPAAPLAVNKASDGTIVEFESGDVVCGSVSIASSTTTYNTTSDRRAKKNITNTNMNIEDLMKIKVRDFDFRSDNTRHTGFIAQELFEVYPDAVHQGATVEEMWGVDYGKITPLLVKSIQELKAENDELRNELEEIKKILDIN